MKKIAVLTRRLPSRSSRRTRRRPVDARSFSKETTMKLEKVQIESIGGIEYLEFPTSAALIEVTGDNGVGKSSVLNAIRCVVEGGHDPALLRLGAKKGVVRLLLDDGTTI